VGRTADRLGEGGESLAIIRPQSSSSIPVDEVTRVERSAENDRRSAAGIAAAGDAQPHPLARPVKDPPGAEALLTGNLSSGPERGQSVGIHVEPREELIRPLCG